MIFLFWFKFFLQNYIMHPEIQLKKQTDGMWQTAPTSNKVSPFESGEVLSTFNNVTALQNISLQLRNRTYRLPLTPLDSP